MKAMIPLNSHADIKKDNQKKFSFFFEVLMIILSSQTTNMLIVFAQQNIYNLPEELMHHTEVHI